MQGLQLIHLSKRGHVYSVLFRSWSKNLEYRTISCYLPMHQRMGFAYVLALLSGKICDQLSQLLRCRCHVVHWIMSMHNHSFSFDSTKLMYTRCAYIVPMSMQIYVHLWIMLVWYLYSINRSQQNLIPWVCVNIIVRIQPKYQKYRLKMGSIRFEIEMDEDGRQRRAARHRISFANFVSRGVKT